MRLSAVACACLILSTGTAPAADLAAHQALYKLTLDSSRGDNVVSAGGTMAYEVLDACDGWAVRQKLKMTVTNRDGQDIEMVSDYLTWEAKDGLSFRFRMKQTTDTAVTSETEGDATLQAAGGRGEAHYTVPGEATKDLPPGTLFPMAHTEALLAAAKAGKKFLALPLFDGTVASGVEDSSIAINAVLPPQPEPFPLISNLPSTRVQIAFFDRDSGSQQPDYQVGMRYWDNGIANDLTMDFGDFVMHGTMIGVSAPPHAC